MEDEATINITMSRVDMGAMTGTSRELIIRHLYDFVEEGAVELIGKKIKITDFEKLTIAANLSD